MARAPMRLRKVPLTMVGLAAALTLISSACSSPEAVRPPTSSAPAAVVSIEQWVDDVCEALHRHLDSPPPEGAGPSDEGIVASLDDMIADIEVLSEAIEAAGIPDVENGAAFSEKILADLEQGVVSLRDAKEVVPTLPEGGGPLDRLDALQEWVNPAVLPVLALSLLLEGDRADVIVLLDDPVRGSTVETVEELASSDPSVTSVVHEDRAATCERVHESTEDNPVLSGNIDCALLPETVRIRRNFDGGSPSTLARSLEEVEGVAKVVVNADVERPIFDRAGLNVEQLGPLRDTAVLSETCVGLV